MHVNLFGFHYVMDNVVVVTGLKGLDADSLNIVSCPREVTSFKSIIIIL